MDFGGGDEIRFERRGAAALVTLARPKALNAVTHGMVGALSRALTAWQADEGIRLVIVTAQGRAFSAGGDIQHIYDRGRAGQPPIAFFADEYRLNAQIARFPKPYIALIDGIVMGGGVGISFHGSHRLMTENAVFAMPEVGIGFFPDVGASHLLPALPDAFGLYLGLTGTRIRAGDALWSGLATHNAAADMLPALVGQLTATGDADAVLAALGAPLPREIDNGQLAKIGRHFSRPSLAEIFASLEAEAPADAFAAETLATLAKRSPTSLAVSFRQIRDGRGLPMDECMKMEFRIVNRMLAGHDFYEGIRAAIIDKGSAPAWRPASIEAVTPKEVDAYFAPLPHGELTFRC